MGTTYEVTVVADSLDDSRLAALRTAIAETLAHIDSAMSTWQPESELSRFNRADTTDPFPVSADVVTVFQHALAVSDLTGGAFDVTVGPLVDAWGFGPPGHPRAAPAEGRPRTPPRPGGLGTVGGGRRIVNHPEARAEASRLTSQPLRRATQSIRWRSCWRVRDSATIWWKWAAKCAPAAGARATRRGASASNAHPPGRPRRLPYRGAQRTGPRHVG